MFQADNLGLIDYDAQKPSTDLAANVEVFQSIFEKDSSCVIRFYGKSDQFAVLYLQGMTDNDLMNRYVMIPLGQIENAEGPVALEKRIPANEAVVTRKFSEAVEALLKGDTIILQQGSPELLDVNTKGYSVRGIAEPDNEKALFGPREGFTEAIVINTSMLRRKLQTSDLKFEFASLGSRTKTRYCVCYLESLVDPKVLQQVQQRLSTVDVDGIMDTYPINERIKDSEYSIFNTIGKSERPDQIASKLLDGGVAIILDGTPVVLYVPYLFIENIQSRDDYYINFYTASIARFLRFFAFVLSSSIGAIYIALVTHHTELLPTGFMLTISAATSALPMPSFVEYLVMMTIFEMLRETGIRMSSKIGQSLSIVGALVIGDAAVTARIISAPMVIIVSISAITGLMVPPFSAATTILRIVAVVAASLYGLIGLGFVFLGTAIHVLSLESFGIQFTANLFSPKSKDRRDLLVRAPTKMLRYRTKFLARDPQRSK